MIKLYQHHTPTAMSTSQTGDLNKMGMDCISVNILIVILDYSFAKILPFGETEYSIQDISLLFLIIVCEFMTISTFKVC